MKDYNPFDKPAIKSRDADSTTAKIVASLAGAVIVLSLLSYVKLSNFVAAYVLSGNNAGLVTLMKYLLILAFIAGIGFAYFIYTSTSAGTATPSRPVWGRVLRTLMIPLVVMLCAVLFFSAFVYLHRAGADMRKIHIRT